MYDLEGVVRRPPALLPRGAQHVRVGGRPVPVLRVEHRVDGHELLAVHVGLLVGCSLARVVAWTVSGDPSARSPMRQMTVDQQAAIALFESLGFKAEALLRDHVRDVDGKKHDIVVLGHNVAQVRAQMEAYGLPGAVQH